MTQSPNQRIDRLEDEFETVKQLLASAARYAESANEGLNRLTERQDASQAQLDQLAVKVDSLAESQAQTQTQLDQLSSRVSEFVFHVQRLLTQQGERLIPLEGQAERLEAVVRLLNRNYEAQQSQLQEFQQTTNAALERIDRVLDYLLREQGRG